MGSCLLHLQYAGNSSGQPVPIGGFVFQLSPAQAREGIEFSAAIVFAGPPFGFDPALLLQFVERWVERAIAHLQHFLRYLPETLTYGPAMQRLQCQNL